MRYLSVCSGIEAASVAWIPLGWQCVGVAEIDPFPNAVLAHHYPDVPNLGDITTINKETFNVQFDVLVGGTPCQGFSVAGSRQGLCDERSALAFEFVRLLDEYRPQWFVWENVPGAFSTGGGEDIKAFFGAINEVGYGVAWRVLDAQFFGVPQRRRRVFAVGYLGDWRPAAAVLFEREGVCGSAETSRPPREATTSCAQSCFRAGSIAGYSADTVAGTVRAAGGDLGGGSETYICERAVENICY